MSAKRLGIILAAIGMLLLLLAEGERVRRSRCVAGTDPDRRTAAALERIADALDRLPDPEAMTWPEWPEGRVLMRSETGKTVGELMPDGTLVVYPDTRVVKRPR